MSNDNRKLYENLRRLFPQRRLKKPATRIAGYDQEPSTFANPVDETTSIPNPDIFVPQPNKSITSEIQNAIEDEGESSTNSLDDSNKERIVTKADDAAVAKADDAVPKADNASDAPSPTPFMRPEPKPPKSLPKVALDLWDVAYESLKSENPGLWKDYERRIDLWLQAGGGKPRYSTKSQSISLSTMNYEERQKQMEGIISLYLSIDQDVETATDAETETDSDIENGEDTEVDRRSYNLSPYIRDIMKSSGYRVGDPSLPWAGICLSIESISYPAYKPKIALSRIGYIISRIRWYILLASLLNDDNDDNDDNFTKRSTIKEQLTLQDRITDLYKEILLYQAHVVCSQTEKIQEKYRTEADQYLLTRDGIISAAGVISAEKALACFSGQQVEEQLNSLAKLYDNETASATRDDKRYADANDVKDVLGRLSAVDPREKILELSEETLNHLYEWLCRTSQYTELTTGNSHGLWITGAPDSGRTMAMWAIIQGLSAQRRQSSHTSFVSFSFCGNGKHEVDSTASVIKTLIHHVLMHQPGLKGHLVDKYESTGRMDFSDGNDAYVLSLALYDIIRDEQFKDTIFLINGIDEIENGVYFTKELINTTISISSKIKWVVATSNSHENIFISTTCSNQEDNLAHMNANDEHSIQQDNIPHIDMNNQQRYIQSILLDCYIPFKVEKLAQYNRLYQGKFRQDVTDLLCKLCPGNSLWVDIACEAIRQEDAWNALDILQRISQNKSENKNPFDPICEQMRINYPWPASKPLNQLSQNLLKHNGTIHKLYSNMLADIAELPFQDSKLCLRILFAMAVMYRPLDLLELEAALDLEPQIDLELLVKKCSAFLEMRGTIVCFTGNSTRNFIRQAINESPSVLHFWTMQACLESLKKFWSQSSKDLPCVEGRRPVSSTNYAAIHWPRHLCQMNNTEHESKTAATFFTENILQWLDLLISSSRLSQALTLISELQNHFSKKLESGHNSIKDIQENLSHIYETQQLLHFHKMSSSPVDAGIKNTLLFCPPDSIIRELFLKQVWPDLAASPTVTNFWSPIIHILKGHSDYVRTCAYSHDGKLLASGSDDGSIRIWDTATGEMQHVIQAFSSYEYIYDIAFSKKGYLAATDRRNIKIWKVATGELQSFVCRESNKTGIVAGIHFSEDGSMLVAAVDASIVIWRVPSFHVILRERNVSPYEAACVRFSRDGAFLGWVSEAHFHIWRLEYTKKSVIDKEETISNLPMEKNWKVIEEKKLRIPMRMSDDWTRGFDFSPDSKYVATGTDESNLVYIWDWKSDAEPTVLTGHTDSVRAVAFSPCGSFLASGSDDATCRIWRIPHDAKQKQPALILRGHTRGVYGLSFSTLSKCIATCSSDKTVRIWDYDTYVTEAKLRADMVDESQPHKRQISRIALSENEKWLASASDDGEICLWNGKSGEFKQRLSVHKQSIESLVFSQDSTRLVSASDDETIGIWDLTGSPTPRLLFGHDNWVRCAVLSRDGKLVASGSDDMTVRVWDITQPGVGKDGQLKGDDEATEEEEMQGVRILRAHEDYVMSVLFSNDGKYVVSGADDGEILLWKVLMDRPSSSQSTTVIRDRGHGRVRTMAFSADSKLFFASCSDSISIWKVDEENKNSISIWKVDNENENMSFQFDSSAKTNSALYSLRILDEFPKYLITEMGPMLIQDLRKASSSAQIIYPLWSLLSVQNRHIDKKDEKWITWGDKKLVFLPQQFYPTSAQTLLIHKQKIIIGCASGQLLFFRFEEDSKFDNFSNL